jgi:hypothetical protein
MSLENSLTMRAPSVLEPLTVQFCEPDTAVPALTAALMASEIWASLSLYVEGVAVLVDADLLEDGRLAGLDHVGLQLGQFGLERWQLSLELSELGRLGHQSVTLRTELCHLGPNGVELSTLCAEGRHLAAQRNHRRLQGGFFLAELWDLDVQPSNLALECCPLVDPEGVDDAVEACHLVLEFVLAAEEPMPLLGDAALAALCRRRWWWWWWCCGRRGLGLGRPLGAVPPALELGVLGFGVPALGHCRSRHDVAFPEGMPSMLARDCSACAGPDPPEHGRARRPQASRYGIHRTGAARR